MTESGHPFNGRSAPLVRSIDGYGDGRRSLHARTHRHHKLRRGEERLAEYFTRRCGCVRPLLTPNPTLSGVLWRPAGAGWVSVIRPLPKTAATARLPWNPSHGSMQALAGLKPVVSPGICSQVPQQGDQNPSPSCCRGRILQPPIQAHHFLLLYPHVGRGTHGRLRASKTS
jgi:hypothetical protein